MAAPLYERIDGHLMLKGFSPDGGSIRFLADDASRLGTLQRASLLRWSSVDGSVQLRLEGIDAPELHYGSAAQPRGASARDALVAWLGVAGITYAGDNATVMASQPIAVPAGILTRSVDARGRVIAYLLRAPPSTSLRKVPRRVRVDASVLRATASYALLEAGHAYLMAYTTLPALHRDTLLVAARTARASALGVWRDDATERGFALHDARSVGPRGALIFPKLFRRCIDYFAQRYAYSLSATFVEWLAGHGSGGLATPDRVVTKRGRAPVALCSLVRETAGRFALGTDTLEWVFVEE